MQIELYDDRESTNKQGERIFHFCIGRDFRTWEMLTAEEVGQEMGGN